MSRKRRYRVRRVRHLKGHGRRLQSYRNSRGGIRL